MKKNPVNGATKCFYSAEITFTHTHTHSVNNTGNYIRSHPPSEASSTTLWCAAGWAEDEPQLIKKHIWDRYMRFPSMTFGVKKRDRAKRRRVFLRLSNGFLILTRSLLEFAAVVFCSLRTLSPVSRVFCWGGYISSDTAHLLCSRSPSTSSIPIYKNRWSCSQTCKMHHPCENFTQEEALRNWRPNEDIGIDMRSYAEGEARQISPSGS